jgi:hypothetical protein
MPSSPNDTDQGLLFAVACIRRGICLQSIYITGGKFSETAQDQVDADCEKTTNAKHDSNWFPIPGNEEPLYLAAPTVASPSFKNPPGSRKYCSIEKQ